MREEEIKDIRRLTMKSKRWILAQINRLTEERRGFAEKQSSRDSTCIRLIFIMYMVSHSVSFFSY